VKRRRLLAALVLWALGWAAADARAADRVAVLILPEPGTDATLADNVTEVAIARIAARHTVEMVGTVELRRRLQMEGQRATLACLDDIACLGRIAVALGVGRVVGGTLRAQPAGGFLIHMTITDVSSGTVTGRFFRLVQGGVDQLIAATQDGADDLFRVREEPGRIRVESALTPARVTIDDLFVGTTPVLSGTLLPGTHTVRVEKENRFPWQDKVTVRPATELEIRLTSDNLPPRRRWPATVGFGGLGAAAFSVGVGATLGALSQVEPDSMVRLRVQEDLRRRQDLATTANVLFVCGAALAVASTAILYLYRRDVIGD
jgi:hypothetical protein